MAARKKLTVRRKKHWRKGYRRKDGTWVKGTWVKASTFKIADRGKKGRGPKKIKIKSEGALGGPGYAEKTATSRHRLLAASVRRDGYARTARRILALRNLGSRTMSKGDLRRLEQDQRWLERTYGRKKRGTSSRRRRKKR